MTQFIAIPAPFATSMNGKQVGPNVFSAVQTLSSDWVTSPNALEEFPDDFANLQQTGWEPVIINLTADDFPQPEPIEE